MGCFVGVVLLKKWSGLESRRSWRVCKLEKNQWS